MIDKTIGRRLYLEVVLDIGNAVDEQRTNIIQSVARAEAELHETAKANNANVLSAQTGFQ